MLKIIFLLLYFVHGTLVVQLLLNVNFHLPIFDFNEFLFLIKNLFVERKHETSQLSRVSFCSVVESSCIQFFRVSAGFKNSATKNVQFIQFEINYGMWMNKLFMEFWSPESAAAIRDDLLNDALFSIVPHSYAVDSNNIYCVKLGWMVEIVPKHRLERKKISRKNYVLFLWISGVTASADYAVAILVNPLCDDNMHKQQHHDHPRIRVVGMRQRCESYRTCF